MNKRKSLRILNIAQFISAFADNAIFFVILGILSKKGFAQPENDMLIVQMGFLFSYILFAPIVGAFADRRKKNFVFAVGNLVKAIGVSLLFLEISPTLAYAITGVGAVILSCPKYGLLTEICKEDTELLLKSNGQIESATIAAILVGTVGGGFLAKSSPTIGVIVCTVLYLLSLFMSRFIACDPGNPTIQYKKSAAIFFYEMKLLFSKPHIRISLIGTSSFWMASAVLRIAFLIWLAECLKITDKFQQSAIVGITGIGIVIGALLAPRFVSVHAFHKSYRYGFAMVGIILLASFPIHLFITAVLLLLIGVSGAMFLVPMNTGLQEHGSKLIGPGKTIAIQNFSENLLMILGISIFQFSLSHGIDIQTGIIGIAIILGLFTFYLHLQTRAPNIK